MTDNELTREQLAVQSRARLLEVTHIAEAEHYRTSSSAADPDHTDRPPTDVERLTIENKLLRLENQRLQAQADAR